MGFTVYYRSTDRISPDIRARINAATDRLCEGRSWLSCEPVWFFMAGQGDCHLEGGSKPNFSPHPDDVAEAESEGLPDGTIMDALDVLCELSHEFGVDWEFCHDHDPGPIGFIRDGEADDRLQDEIESICIMAETFARQSEAAAPLNLRPFRRPLSQDDEDDDDGPKILKFSPRE
jgi:hypothetical protein